MNFDALMNMAREASGNVRTVLQGIQQAGAALTSTQVDQLRAQLDEIHPRVMEAGAALDAKLEKAKNR